MVGEGSEAAQVENERRFKPGMPAYFENVFLAYRDEVWAQKYSAGIDQALKLFEDYQNDAMDFEQQHKGSPFYVMGYAAFASRDYPTASLMFDAAVAEDLRYWGPTVALTKPALLFMRLKDEQQEVLASQIVRDNIEVVERLLVSYASRAGARPLSLDDFRDCFFDRFIQSQEEHKRTLVTTFISFIAEWRYRSRLIGLIHKGSREPFFLHLYRGCVLLESLLKESPQVTRNPGTLDKAIIQMRSHLSMPASYKISARSFDRDVLQKIDTGFSAGQAVEYAGRCRNTLGHSLAWETPSLDRKTYDLLVELIATACIHAIATTYR